MFPSRFRYRETDKLADPADTPGKQVFCWSAAGSAGAVI
jgi:hypothetical protein